MSFVYHHPDKWLEANLDLIEETLEQYSKAVVFLSGASSSGKSYCAKLLEEALKIQGHHPVTISLDSYNVGLSGIIPNQVNEHFYDGKMEHLPAIKKAVKGVITDIPFSQKYDQEALSLIAPVLEGLVSKKELPHFLSLLNLEWQKLNFDEPSVYDMEEAACDIQTLLNGKSIERKAYSKIVSERVSSGEIILGEQHDIIIVEGIYALEESLIRKFPVGQVVTNFVDGNPKSLFLRRIIRDAKSTSAGTAFTLSIYFKYIVPSYLKTILPAKEKADVVFVNDMTLGEMKSGELYTTKLEFHTDSREILQRLLRESEILSVSYVRDTFLLVPEESEKSDNILRLRSVSYDEGKTYVPSSLAHKGMPKIRKDGKIIRPVNVFLKDGEFKQVWPDEEKCLNDFVSAGFVIGPVEHKIKYCLRFLHHGLTVREVENKGYFVEIEDSTDEELTEKVKRLLDGEEKES